MAIAPEPYLTACMAVMREAILWARQAGYRKNVVPEQLGDLMDAIHNIPHHAQHWETCDVELLRSSFLGVYERRWGNRGGPLLLSIFDQSIKESGGVA